ncbi:MAG TPA: hypothetical protein ENI82_03070, partial [Bacteroidetes bacterium]|nr:hypothetical protein [Bacteroidota bacterium]
MKTINFLSTLIVMLLFTMGLQAQNKILDTDGNTKVETERTVNDDIIRFKTGGTDALQITGQRLEPLNTGLSIFLGQNAGMSDDLTNNQGVFIGYNAGRQNTSGLQNSGIGIGALQNNTSGSFNLGLGSFSMNANTTGTYNAGVGANSLLSNTTGVRNLGLGANSMRDNTTGTNNTGLGYNALYKNTVGHNNVGLGSNSGYNTTSGSGNISIGRNANFYNQTGSNNTIVGFQAGQGASLHNKSGNILIGYQAGFNETGSNKLYIENSDSSSPLLYGDFANDYLRVYGKLGVGVTPSVKIHAYENSVANGFHAQVIKGINVGTGTGALFTSGTSQIGWSATPAAIYTQSNNGADGAFISNAGNGQGVIGQTSGTGDAIEGWAFGSGRAGWFHGGDVKIDDNLHVGTRIGVGTTAPLADIHIKSSGEMLRLEGSGSSNYMSIYQGATRKAIIWNTGDNLKVRSESGNVSLQTDGSTDRLTAFGGSGDIGIGTTAANQRGKLHVKNASGINDPELNLESTGVGFSRLEFSNSGGDGYWHIAADANGSPKMNFWFDDDGSAGANPGTDIMTIDGSKHVGFKNTTPLYPVHAKSNDETASGGIIYAENTAATNTDVKAIRGRSVPAPGYGYGAYGEGGYRGVYGYGNGSTYTGTATGVMGIATGSAGTRIGVYGSATGSATNKWAGYFAG